MLVDGYDVTAKAIQHRFAKLKAPAVPETSTPKKRSPFGFLHGKKRQASDLRSSSPVHKDEDAVPSTPSMPRGFEPVYSTTRPGDTRPIEVPPPKEKKVRFGISKGRGKPKASDAGKGAHVHVITGIQEGGVAKKDGDMVTVKYEDTEAIKSV